MVMMYKDLTSQVYGFLPMQILTSSFHHFPETVQVFDQITYFHQEKKTLKRRYFNIFRQLIIFFRDLMKYLISTFPCDIAIELPLRRLRLKWCRARRDWTVTEWNQVALKRVQI
ncbi:hypothetical protein TNCV_1334351 [Trichonephila clavipes]|nr:hypothetical protein TNCV_1334351 [Trichonephila clavipes]